MNLKCSTYLLYMINHPIKCITFTPTLYKYDIIMGVYSVSH